MHHPRYVGQQPIPSGGGRCSNKIKAVSELAEMLLLVKCYDNKMVKLPGISYFRIS